MNEPPTALQEESCFTHCITGLWSRHMGRTLWLVNGLLMSVMHTISNFSKRFYPSVKDMYDDDDELAVDVD